MVEHARASLTPESREARDLIAYLHRSRDEMEQIKRQSREELAQLEARAAIAADRVGGAAEEAHRGAGAKLSGATQKRLETEVARLTR